MFFGFKKKLFKNFQFSFPLAMYKRVKLSAIFERLRLFKGLCLLFLPNVPGAMFIQGGTFIPDYRVEVHRALGK